MNLRGAGDSEAIYPRLYNAGLDGDLSATVWALARESLHMGAAGFSLGGNLLLLLLSRRRRELPDALRAAVAVSAPVDLSACARALETPRNRLYQHYFMRSLKAAYSRLQRLGPEVYAEGRERDARTIREYDEVITAPYGGYRSADEYYARSSAGPGIRDIERPTLLLSAEDDPMVPDGSVRAWPVPASGVVEREILPTGGHMGFVAPTIAPGRFWAAERLLAFLEEHMPAGLLVPRPPEELPRPTRP
jgi:predicted alpha/beta-fold hydrolase